MGHDRRFIVLVLLLTLLPSPPASGQLPAVRSYVLGPGDVLEILVERNEDLTRTVTVRADGTISLSLIGSVMAAGLTLAQLETRLTKLYTRYLKSPRVVVNIVRFRLLRVAIVGQVVAPGAFEVIAGSTVLDAVAKAGGPTPAAGATQAYIIRDGRQVIALDLQELLKGTGVGNVPLQDGDIIVVPQAANILVVGDGVAKPGAFPARQGMTLLDVLLQAGGVTERVSLAEAKLIRTRNEVVPVDWEALLLKLDIKQDVSLQGGDVILIPEDRNRQVQVFVLGEVRSPGAFSFRTVRTAFQGLITAGGPTSEASLKDAYLVRRNPAGSSGDGGLIKVDLTPMFQRGDLSKDVPLQAGDVLYVPRQRLFSFNAFLQTILSILTGLRIVR